MHLPDFHFYSFVLLHVYVCAYFYVCFCVYFYAYSRVCFCIYFCAYSHIFVRVYSNGCPDNCFNNYSNSTVAALISSSPSFAPAVS